MAAQRSVRRRIDVAAAPGRTWAALTQPALLAAWLGEVIELDLRPAGEGAVREPDGTVRRIVVESVEPEEGLVLHWWTEPLGEDAPEPSTVVLRLTPTEGGTTVEVTETAIADLSGTSRRLALALVGP